VLSTEAALGRSAIRNPKSAIFTERLFFTGMAVAAAVSVFLGFARSFYLKPYFPTVGPTLTPLLVAHGLIFSSWIALFVTQTVLVATRRTSVHRRLGWVGAGLAALMVVVGTLTGIVRAKIGDTPAGAPQLAFLTVPLGDVFVFGCLVGAAVYYRRRVDVHKRLMTIATLAVLPAAFARWPFAFAQRQDLLFAFGLSDLAVVFLLAYDLATRGRPHLATVVGGLLLVVSHPLRMIVGVTQPWLTFAGWLTSWVS
jgi:hypothetical protein